MCNLGFCFSCDVELSFSGILLCCLSGSLQPLSSESVRAQRTQHVPAFEKSYVKHLVMLTSGSSFFIPFLLQLDPAGPPWPFSCRKGRRIRPRAWVWFSPAPLPAPAVRGDALGCVVESRTAGDRPRGFVQPSPTAVCLSELVLSRAPRVRESRLCLYPARPCSAAENVPELLVVRFRRLLSRFSSLAALPLPERCQSCAPAGCSAANRPGAGRTPLRCVTPHSAPAAASWFGASPAPASVCGAFSSAAPQRGAAVPGGAPGGSGEQPPGPGRAAERGGAGRSGRGRRGRSPRAAVARRSQAVALPPLRRPGPARPSPGSGEEMT